MASKLAAIGPLRVETAPTLIAVAVTPGTELAELAELVELVLQAAATTAIEMASATGSAPRLMMDFMPPPSCPAGPHLADLALTSLENPQFCDIHVSERGHCSLSPPDPHTTPAGLCFPCSRRHGIRRLN
jgi:hypothetical protein